MKEKFIFPIKRNGEIYRYMVRFTINQEKIYVGCFKSVEDAKRARDNHKLRPHNKSHHKTQKETHHV